ncbi:MAG TPA: hypothetical protein VGD60_09340 [Candidatus Acidoferrales bacterium]
MDTPDQRLFDADVASAEFRAGALKGYWGLAGAGILPEQPAWPMRVLWIAAASRPNAPDRYYVRLDLSNYRTVAPTGTFWDPSTKDTLDLAKRPKGRSNSRFAMVFRTDWEGGRAFYHPYDRVAAQGHTNWPGEQPSLIWDSNHTIVDCLEEFHSLLNCGDYLGL